MGKFGCAFSVVSAARLIIILTVIYVAVHFIVKFW
jgi:hypothetical protein